MRSRRSSQRAFALYVASALFLVGWWWAAFHSYESSYWSAAEKESPYRGALFARERLLNALRGDWKEAKTLLAEWYLDSPQNGSLFAEALALGQLIDQQRESDERIFAQTYVAATILLAILGPEQIVAIPRGLREEVALFPKIVTNQISFDCENCGQEMLSAIKPSLAVVADYSNPSTLGSIEQLHIPSYRSNGLTSLESALYEIEAISSASNREREGRFLRLFVELALLRIDELTTTLLGEGKRIFLSKNMGLSLPPKESVTSDLLSRFGSFVELYDNPMKLEELMAIDPCLVICSSFQPSKLPKLKTAWVDEAVQNSPTQFIALAYYDLAVAMLGSEG